MYNGFIFSRFFLPEKRGYFMLVLSWVIGLLLGILLITTDTTIYEPVIYAALRKRPSIVPHILICALFFIVITLLRNKHCFVPIISFLFLQGISRGFSGMALYTFTGSGAWAVRMMFLFSGASISVITWWLLFRYCDHTKADLVRTSCLSVVFVLIILIVDYLVISPLTVSIINQIF